MKRLFLICFVCSTFIGCNKPFTEETVSDLAIKTLSAFEAEVKNPDNDLVAIVGELCEKAGMEIDKSVMVDDAENAVLYNILMEEGPTFEIGVEDYDQYTNVHIGFVYPKDVTQGNGIPKKLYNNLVSTLASSGMEYYTGYSDPKNINPITSIYSSYKEYDNGVMLIAGTIDKVNANKPEDKFFLTAVNALHCISTHYDSYEDFEVSFKKICENGGLTYSETPINLEMGKMSNSYYTMIDNIMASICCAESNASDFFGERYKGIVISLAQLQDDSDGISLSAFCDKLKYFIEKHKDYGTYNTERSNENTIILLYMR